MKQVFWITPNLTNGGAEKVTAILANEINSNDWNSTVIFMKDDKSTYHLEESVKRRYLFTSGMTIKKVFVKILRLRNIIKQNPDATFVAMLPYETLYLFMANIGLNRKVVCSLRNDPHSMHGVVNWLVSKIIYPSVSCVVFQTMDACVFFSEKIRKKSVVIPNPIFCKEEPFFGDRSREFVSAGRLANQKNYPLMLRAFKMVINKYPDWKLKIYGDGDQKDKLIELRDKLGLRDAVYFMGFQENISQKIRESWAFILSSDFEGISNAMLEALSMGIPCICTDCPIGGAKMFIKDGINGYLSVTGDEHELSKKMISVIENPISNTLLKQSSFDIRKQLSAGAIAENWKDIL